MIRWVLGELWADRIRMGLVALGVLWGTLGMASLLSFGGEMLRATGQTTANFGVDLLRVSGASTTTSWRGQAAGRRVRLALGDEAAVAALPGVRGAAWEELRGSQLSRAGDRRHSGTIVGTQPEFSELRSKRAVRGGRFLSARDVLEQRLVCYLGSDAATALFGDRDPVGNEVEVMGSPLRVVGVGPRQVQISNYEGVDRDKIYLPITTFQALAGPAYGTLVVGLEEGDESRAMQASVRGALARLHDFDPDDESALNITDYVVLQNRIGTILRGNRALTAVVAVLGFLVAALGVANATWARVEEKRREIALAMALGARRIHVMLPPLLEASITALVGGLIGLLLAAGVFAMAAAVDAPLEARAYLGTPRVSLTLGAAVVLALSFVGALSGWFPARQAASVDPIQVLRDE